MKTEHTLTSKPAWMFMFFIVVELTGKGNHAQEIILCERPEFSKSCLIQCSTKGTKEKVLLFKDNQDREIAECSKRDICTDNENIYSFRRDDNTVVFLIRKLEIHDSGEWWCKSGQTVGKKKDLEVYSFKKENVNIQAKYIDLKTFGINVDIKCVYPNPKLVVRHGDTEVCEKQGDTTVNGKCDNNVTANHVSYYCEFQYNNIGRGKSLDISVHFKNHKIQLMNDIELPETVDDDFSYEEREDTKDTFSIVTYVAMLGTILGVMAISVLLYIAVLWARKQNACDWCMCTTLQNEQNTEKNLQSEDFVINKTDKEEIGTQFPVDPERAEQSNKGILTADSQASMKGKDGEAIVKVDTYEIIENTEETTSQSEDSVITKTDKEEIGIQFSVYPERAEQSNKENSTTPLLTPKDSKGTTE